MIITVNYTDVTAFVAADSVNWNRSGTFNTEVSFTLETDRENRFSVKTGMNAELYVENKKVWGGIVSETKEIRRSKTRSALSVKCKGYESVTTRKVSDELLFENMTSGQIAEQIFLTYLVNEEGFQYLSNNFDTTGEVLEKYSSAGAKLSKLFDDLAQATGKKWWVTADKEFFFKQNIPLAECPYCIDLDGNSSNANTSISNLNFSGKSTDYRNVQIVFGKNNIRGEARNEAEIARMAEFGGSGEYANITVNRNILTQEAANTAAANILKSYEDESLTVSFTTSRSEAELFNIIHLRASDYGFSEFAKFIITEISAKSLKNGEFIYDITARYSADTKTEFRPPDSWQEQFNQLINKNDGNVQGSGGTASSGMTPDDIIAGKNITLEKTETSVTINAIQEALLAMTSADFTENEVKYTLEDGAEVSYTFGFDSYGNLISLTDENGFVIRVSGLQ